MMATIHQRARIETMKKFLELERKVKNNAMVHDVDKYCEVAERFVHLSGPVDGVNYLKRALDNLKKCSAPTQHYQLKLHLNLGMILPKVATTEEAFANMIKSNELHNQLSNMNESMKLTIFSWMGLSSQKQKDGFVNCLKIIRLPMLDNSIEVYKKMGDTEKWLDSGLLWLKYALQHDYLRISDKRDFWVKSAAVYAILCLRLNNLHQMHYLLRAANYVLSLPKPMESLNIDDAPNDKSAPVWVKLGFVMFNLRWLSFSKTYVDNVLLPEGVDEINLPTEDESELNDVGDMVVTFEQVKIADVDEDVFAKSCVEILLESSDIERVYVQAKKDFREAQKMINKLGVNEELKTHVNSCLEQFDYVEKQYQFTNTKK